MPVFNGVNSASYKRQVSSELGPKVKASIPPFFALYVHQSQCCRVLLPTTLHCSSGLQLSAASARDTGDDVTRCSELFLKYE